MGWTRHKNIVIAARSLLLTILVWAHPAFAVEPTVESNVDVYWKATRTIVAPGVSTVIVLDDEVAHAAVGNDTIEFAGLTRGDTVALAYIHGAPVSIVVHVIDRPVNIIPPSLLRRQAEMAQGVIASDLQATSGNSSTYTLLSSFGWSQQVGDHSMNFTSQVEDNNQFGGHGANLRTAGLSYRTPGLSVNVIDFSQSLTGATAEDRINNFSSGNDVQLRGAGITLNSRKNQFSVFAGSTVPYYFLSLNATRDAAGFSFRRRQTDKLNLYGGASYVSIPLSLTNGTQRRGYAMETGGLSYHVTKGLLVGGQAGMANDKSHLLRGDFSFASYRFSAYGSAIAATQTFPLTQIQSLFSGTSVYKGETDFRVTQRLSQRFYYEHNVITPGLIYRVAGTSDYLSPSLAYLLSRGETLGFSYIYSRNTGGLTTTTSTGNRYDAFLNSQITQNTSNNAEVTIGSIQDPLQINSEDRLSIRDTVSFAVKRHQILLGVEHDRVQPSLLAKLNQEINLLSPALQAQFLADPNGFIDSANFPPEVKALLAAEHPVGTTISASSVLEFGGKFRFSPSASATHSTNGGVANEWTQTVGYTFAYQFRPTLQFRSSLNNLMFWDATNNTLQRTTLLSFGFQKTFLATPGVLPLVHRGRMVEGRVFRDNNINGYFNAGEPGLAGVEVRLDDGQLAVTDELGRYKFGAVSADQHQVSIALTQFHNPVRMTTRSEAEIDLIQQRVAVVNFGILDFARLMGNIYNDLRFENQRQPDSKGMPEIQLLLENGKELRKIQTGGSGDFEVDNLPPGDYKLSVDAASIPANYIAPVESLAVHVSPVSTVVQDIPMRALRSIAGNVLLKVPNENVGSRVTKRAGRVGKTDSPADQDFKLIPVRGVQIAAGTTSAVTDNDGKFLLRNLPAGDLKVTVTPVKPVPSEITVPSGKVTLPPEPVQIEGATIVITNAELMPYLTRELPGPHAVSAPPVPATEVTPQTTTPAPSASTATSPQRKLIDNASWPSSDAALTRSLCAQLPSLGEIAQCLRQLKLNSSPEPKK